MKMVSSEEDDSNTNIDTSAKKKHKKEHKKRSVEKHNKPPKHKKHRRKHNEGSEEKLKHDKFILEAYFRSGQQNDNGTWDYSIRSCHLQFLNQFPNEAEVDYEIFAQHVRRIVARFHNIGSICKLTFK